MSKYFKILSPLLLFCAGVFGQVKPINVYRSSPAVTVNDAYLHPWKGFTLPIVSDTTHGVNGSLDSVGQLIYVKSDGKIYQRDSVPTGGHVWTAVGTGSGGGGSTDTTHLSARINLKVDSVKRKPGTDSNFYYIAGTPHFAGKDTASLATILASLGYTPLAPGDTTYLHALVSSKVGNFLGVPYLGYGPHSSAPTSGQAMYYDTDSASLCYRNGGSYTNLFPATNILLQSLAPGAAGDTNYIRAVGGNLLIAPFRDSANSCFRHTVNPDGTWTWYSTCWLHTGNYTYDVTDSVGVGTATPTARFSVAGKIDQIQTDTTNTAGTRVANSLIVRLNGNPGTSSVNYGWNLQISSLPATSHGKFNAVNINYDNAPGFLGTLNTANGIEFNPGTTGQVGTFTGLQLNDGNGTTGYNGIFSAMTSGTGKFFINHNGTAPSRFSGAIGINNASPDASAWLDITGTTKGVLIPRMTTANRNALTPATGLIIFNLDSAGTGRALQYYTGSVWIAQGGIGGSGGSSTTDTTLIGNGSGGSPLGVNQNIVNAAYWVLVHPYPSTNNTLFYGNSITYGYCPSCGSGTEVAYPTILQNGLGNTTVNNGAVSSTGVRTAYNYLSSTMPVAGAPTVGEAAFNNIRILMTGDTLHRFGHVKSGYRAIAALQFLNPATIQFYFTGSGAGSVNSNITTSLACGSCTAAIDTLKDFSSRAVFYRASVAGQSGTNWWLKNSITANETVTIANVRGAGIAIGTWADSVGWSRIQVSVDGSVVTTYNPNDRITMLNFDATFHRFGIQNDAIVIQGLQDTLHTVVLTFLDGTKMGGFDYVAGLKNPASCYTTPAYIYDIMHMGAAGYSYSLAPTTQAVQDSCNSSRWYDLFNNFGAYGYPIHQVHENYPVGHYDPTDPNQIQGDGIHPSGLGQRNIAADGLSKMNYRQNYNATASAPSAPTLPVGPTGAVQFAGAAGFAGTSDVVIDSTNKGVTYGGYLEAQAINSSNAFFGYNAKVVSGSYTYINTAPAAGLQFFVGGGLGFFANPSGTAAASFTRTFPFYANTSGQIQLGGNVSFTPSSFVDLPAATTSNASLYIAPGSQPTSGLKVGLFYTTSAGHLFFHNGTAFQQLDAQVPGTASTNNLMYWTGTQVGGFGKWDATNNWLALGANAPTPFSDLSVNHNFAGFTEFRVSNSNAGGQSGFQAVNDQAGAIGIRAAGSTIGNVGPWLQGSGVLYNNINNDMGIMNNSAHDVYVATGSGTASDKFRIFSGGQIGLTTYTGTTFYKHLDSTNYKPIVQDAAGKLWSTDWPAFGSGGSTPTLQQVFNVGGGGKSFLTKSDTISGGTNFNVIVDSAQLVSLKAQIVNIVSQDFSSTIGVSNGGTIGITGGLVVNSITQTGSFTLTNALPYWFINLQATSNSVITLPTQTTNHIKYKLINQSASTITWTFANGTLIDGLGNNVSNLLSGWAYEIQQNSSTVWQIKNVSYIGAGPTGIPIAGSFSAVGTATTTFTVTTGITEPNSTYKVNVTPTDALGAALFYVTNKTATTFDVVYLSGLTGTVTFDWVVTP